ncbi:MAG: choloylglycine hydrolase [Bacteroidales bacterium]|nr:MAG: choloylglycine hydrolase [Bacteroidales bacterium]
MLRILKRIGYVLGILTILILLGSLILTMVVELPNPSVPDLSPTRLEKERISDEYFSIGRNWLKKSRQGLYELYVEGEPFERGVITGKLTRELIHQQEEYFIGQIRELIPSDIYLRFLKYFISWFNRKLDKYIGMEYLLEIYGISLSASDDFNYIAKPYQRILNYHAAHDIGHALQDFRLVGCTSFALWDSKSEDSTLIHGRNFDFYMGDDFAKNKIISFIRPDSGFNFMIVTWGGMIGAVSGMNDQGLSITINAAKSSVPTVAKTPITLLTREILQYAGTIEEAFEIAGNREIFVSESIMVSSAKDNQTAIIEKTPEEYVLYGSDTNFIVCTNHFQSDYFISDTVNRQNIQESSSLYRLLRVKELLKRNKTVSVQGMVNILRDRKGMEDRDIGLGNEKAINQLIAHHSIVFKPKEKQFWISTNPYQLGEYISYDLDDIFGDNSSTCTNMIQYDTMLTIPADTFLTSIQYQDFLLFNKLHKQITEIIDAGGKGSWSRNNSALFIQSNREYYLVYDLLGDLHYSRKEFSEAKKYYDLALTKEVTSVKEENEIREKLNRCHTKLKKQKNS